MREGVGIRIFAGMNPNLHNSVRDGFNEIIAYHTTNRELHARAAHQFRAMTSIFVEETRYTFDRLRHIISKYNYDTTEPDQRTGVWPDLEFWTDAGDVGCSVALNYGGDVDILHEEPQVVRNRNTYTSSVSEADRLAYAKAQQAIKIDTKQFPISHLGYYADRTDHSAIFYAWIAWLWQEVEGHRCELFVRTVENSSIERFSINDFLRNALSRFDHSTYEGRPPRLKQVFWRKLTLQELYIRASLTAYPFNPYQTFWRYLERGEDYIEIGAYANKTGVRSGKIGEQHLSPLGALLNNVKSAATISHIIRFVDARIAEGWEEKLRPTHRPLRLHNEAYSFGLWTGISWHADQECAIRAERVKELEARLGVRLPLSYFTFLKLLNGRQHNTYHRYFPVDHLYTVLIKKFFNIDELGAFAQTGKAMAAEGILRIGMIEGGKELGLVVKEAIHGYGQMAIVHDDHVELCAYPFEIFIHYAQSSPVQPEIFAAEENDVAFLRKRLSDGWDCTSVYSYQTAVRQAAEHNAHEALELLLASGANLGHYQHRDMGYQYDERTMEILDKAMRS